jgi:hypothetical protein
LHFGCHKHDIPEFEVYTFNPIWDIELHNIKLFNEDTIKTKKRKGKITPILNTGINASPLAL